jgi:hypothetical protein
MLVPGSHSRCPSWGQHSGRARREWGKALTPWGTGFM